MKHDYDYTCPRCGYRARNMSRYIGHTKRTQMCSSTLSDKTPTRENVIMRDPKVPTYKTHTFALPIHNTEVVSTWPQILAPDFYPHARNLLDSLTDDEYDAMRKRVLGEDHVARNPTPSSHETSLHHAPSSSEDVEEVLAMLRSSGVH